MRLCPFARAAVKYQHSQDATAILDDNHNAATLSALGHCGVFESRGPQTPNAGPLTTRKVLSDINSLISTSTESAQLDILADSY